MKLTICPAVCSALIATTCLTFPAQAQDVPPAAAALLKAWEAQSGSKPTYEKIESAANGDVTITNLQTTITADNAIPVMKLTMGKVVASGVGAEQNGLIEIANAELTDGKLEFLEGQAPVVTVTMPRISAEGLYLSVPDANPTPQQLFRASMSLARKTSSDRITITAKDQTYTIEGYTGTWNGDPITGAGTFSLALGDIVIPESAIASMDATGELKKLGYSDLRMKLLGEGELKVNDAAFGFSGTFQYGVNDMGNIKLSVSASEIPISAANEIQAASKAGREPNMNALMPQLMGVTFNNFQFRFEDASITKKLLPILAKMQGMDEAAAIANAGAMVQISLMQLKNQAFTDQAVASINAFLKDPKSLTISLKPAAPIKVQQMMMFDPNNPGAAIDQLGVSVTAND